MRTTFKKKINKEYVTFELWEKNFAVSVTEE